MHKINIGRGKRNVAVAYTTSPLLNAVTAWPNRRCFTKPARFIALGNWFILH